MEQIPLLSTKEVAERLGLTVTTIYQYVKNKKLTPVYEDWSVDETMLFYESDVEKIENQKPSGFTTSQVAKILGVHQTTISKQIKEGKIPANKIRYRGRMTYFVQEDILKNLEERYSAGNKYRICYQPKWNYYLFQSFLNEQTKAIARIIEFTKGNDSGIALTDSGEKLELESLKQKGFIPLEHFQDKKMINRPGFVHFRFEQPVSLHSFVYELIEAFYRAVGYRNLKIREADGHIDIYIKPFLFKQNEEYFTMLEEHLISGKVTQRHNGILLDSGVERLTIYPSTEQKKKMKVLADERGIAMNDLIIEILDHYLDQ
ncbi:helix-turn-helix domain-containing protein [Virgibacillus soli]|uniref:Helix-turn-helix domain-containing protein n=1 Tax=Paracerasibacillus soli TaxID=480284 RepID=A0ABU5CQW9_9BACI|nr:helix-turn-helix domain-containing protein [Virgibacillus soli]MDY0408251.1 helix-turn-helix domain-containing protein [Virgibacillus soli]